MVRDNIEIRSLKLVSDFIALPMSHIIDLSLSSGIFPSPWKRAKIIPLKKNKEHFSPKNSRPIIVLPAVSKIMERLCTIKLKIILK